MNRQKKKKITNRTNDVGIPYTTTSRVCTIITRTDDYNIYITT